MKSPHLISFSSKGHTAEGHLHIIQAPALPFAIQRVFYTVDTPQHITRGRHAHYHTEMILIAIQGSIEVRTITIDSHESIHQLNDPSVGLYLPVLCWHEMKYSADAVQLVLCSSEYAESDYIRDWHQFNIMQQQYAGR